MAKDWPFLDVPSGPAIAILECLDTNWPQPIDLSPGRTGLTGQEREFLVALVALLDAGWLMCEALLAGERRTPRALDAVVTPKGREGLIRFREAG